MQCTLLLSALDAVKTFRANIAVVYRTKGVYMELNFTTVSKKRLCDCRGIKIDELRGVCVTVGRMEEIGKESFSIVVAFT